MSKNGPRYEGCRLPICKCAVRDGLTTEQDRMPYRQADRTTLMVMFGTGGLIIIQRRAPDAEKASETELNSPLGMDAPHSVDSPEDASLADRVSAMIAGVFGRARVRAPATV